MGSALKSQVTFGAGFPPATQVKRAEEPAATAWSPGPSTTEAGSVEEAEDKRTSERLRWHRHRRRSGPILTKNVYGVAGSDDGPLTGRTGVGPGVARLHGDECQVVT